MLNLRKETEIAIHLLKYLAKNKNKITSLKEVADELEISFLFLQKIARKLKNADLIVAQQGVNGGYKLISNLKDINLQKIIEIMEDKCVLLSCMKKKDCKKYNKCSTRICLEKLNKKILKLMQEIKLSHL